MPRPVRELALFWEEREFRKALNKLPEAERRERLQQLVEFTQALGECTHPALDPNLQPWRPSAYHVRKVDSTKVKLYEYRCTYPMRIVARWIDPGPEEPDGVVLLIVGTLSHDHERLKEVIFRNRSDLDEG